MVRIAISLALSLGLSLAASPNGAGAWAATPDAGLEPQLRAWIAGVTGLSIPELPLSITPEGDHFHVAIPVPGLVVPSGEPDVTATLRPLEGGRWAVDHLIYPPSFSFTMPVPAPGAPGRTVPGRAKIDMAGQDGRILLDPSLATPTTFSSEARGVTLEVTGGGQRQLQRIDRTEAHGTVTDAGGGRLDLVQDASGAGWQIDVQPAASAPFAVAARSITASGRLHGVNRDRIAPLAVALAALVAARPEDKAARRAGLHQLVEALRDSVQSGRLDETVHALRVSGSGVQAGAETVRLGFGADAPGAVLGSWMELEVAGLDAGSVPPGVAAWLPRRIALRPTLSGVRVADLTRLALLATEPKPTDKQALDPAIAALFAGPGMTIGIDPLVIELPAARLDATGHVVLRGPDRYDGQARVSLTGFDALLAQASHDPALQQVVPALVMARGLSRPEEDRLVWDIVSDGKGLTINGVDASSLLGGGASAAPSPGRKRPDARPQVRPQPGPSR